METEYIIDDLHAGTMKLKLASGGSALIEIVPWTDAREAKLKSLDVKMKGLEKTDEIKKVVWDQVRVFAPELPSSVVESVPFGKIPGLLTQIAKISVGAEESDEQKKSAPTKPKTKSRSRRKATVSKK